MQLRDMAQCAKARSWADWDRTASLIAAIANGNRDPKKKPKAWSALDFHPWRKREDDQDVLADRRRLLLEAKARKSSDSTKANS